MKMRGNEDVDLPFNMNKLVEKY